MKKLLFLLLISGSILGCDFIEKTIVFLIKPIHSASMDDKAEYELQKWYSKGKYTGGFLDDLIKMNTGDERGVLQEAFPDDEASITNSIDKIAKIKILDNYGCLDGLLESNGIELKLYTSNIDYEKIWQQQPIKNRLWWTIYYRRPYNYIPSIAKWGAELGIVYGVYRLAKWYKAKNSTEK